jgi:hypothetical protein
MRGFKGQDLENQHVERTLRNAEAGGHYLKLRHVKHSASICRRSRQSWEVAV